jgi:hypothetical protein
MKLLLSLKRLHVIGKGNTVALKGRKREALTGLS